MPEEIKLSLMKESEIDSVVAEFGIPTYFETEDQESGFWQFDETDMFVADSFGHLLAMGIEFIKLHEKGSRFNREVENQRI